MTTPYERWRALTAGVPWGHSGSAHVLLGWCGACPGRDLLEEAVAWRGWAFHRIHADPGFVDG